MISPCGVIALDRAVEQLVALMHDVGLVVGPLNHRDQRAAALHDPADRDLRRRVRPPGPSPRREVSLLSLPGADQVQERIAPAVGAIGVRLLRRRCRRRRRRRVRSRAAAAPSTAAPLAAARPRRAPAPRTVSTTKARHAGRISCPSPEERRPPARPVWRAPAPACPAGRTSSRRRLR